MAEAVCSADIVMSGALEREADASARAFFAQRAAPQAPQNRLPDGLLEPHLGQRFASGAPQSPQNLLSSGFSPPQLEHRIGFDNLLDSYLLYHVGYMLTNACCH